MIQKNKLNLAVLAIILAASISFAEDTPFAPVPDNALGPVQSANIFIPTPDTRADNCLLAGDLNGAFKEYKKLLISNINSPAAEYYFAKCMSVIELSAGAIPHSSLVDVEKTKHKNEILRACIEHLKMELLLKQGRLQEAAQAADDLGFIKDWLIIGPFDNATKSGYKKVYPPETEFVLDKAYEGKNGKNSWRRLSVRPPFGRIDFSGLFRANDYVVAYAAVFVNSEKEQGAAFRFGSTGPVKMWLNDCQITGVDAYRDCRFDQNCASGRLRKGWNKLVVKTCQKSGWWEAAVRVTAPDGGRIKGVFFQNDPDIIMNEILPAYLPDTMAVQPPADAGAIAYFSGLLDRNSQDHFALAGISFMYNFKDALDENDKTVSDNIRKALENNPGSDFCRYLAGTNDDDRNKRLDALLALAGKNTPCVLALYELSKLYSDGSGRRENEYDLRRSAGVSSNEAEEIRKTFAVPMEVKEEEYLIAALRQRPDFTAVSLSLAKLYRRRGEPWNIESEKIISKLSGLLPSNIEIQRGVYDENMHTMQENLQYSRKLIGLDYTDRQARNDCIYYLKRFGEKDAVLAEYRVFLELNPFDSSVWREMAEFHEGFEEYDMCIASLDSALKTNPEDISSLKALGDYYLMLGNRQKAQECWETALSIKPNLPDVSEHLESLKPQEKKFWEGISDDLSGYVNRALADTDFPPEATAVHYLKNEIIKVNPNGTSSTFVQRVVKVLDEKGVNEYKYVSVDSDSSEYYAASKYKIISAKLYKQDGSVLEGDRYEESDYVSFETLEEGDVIAYEGRIDEQGEPRYKGYYGGIIPLQKNYDPVKDSKVTILSPTDKKLYFAADKFSAKPREFEKEGMLGRTWEVHDLPQIDPEPLMPGFYEVVPYLQVSTFETWDETAAWVTDLVSEQFESSPAIKQVVLDTVKGLESDEEKVKALYQKMVSEIRYEALSLDSHAYKPFKASETFDRKYGDCKDTACLFVTMLREAGIDANFILVRVRDSGRISTKVPSMKIFNHAIVYVPYKDGSGRFYDGTARYWGADEKPYMDEGALAFIIDMKGGGRLVEEIPFSSPEDNVDENNIEITVNADGSAAVQMIYKIRGKLAGEIRSVFQEGADRQKYFEQMMNRYFGTVAVKSLEFSDLSEYNMPVEMKAEFTTPSFARVDGTKISFNPAVFTADLSDRFASLEKREYELVLDSYPIAYPKKSVNNLTFNIPAGYEISKLPEDAGFSSDFGTYNLVTDRISPARFTVKTEFTVTLLRINKDQYPAFRSFCADVDRLEKEDAVIEK